MIVRIGAAGVEVVEGDVLTRLHVELVGDEVVAAARLEEAGWGRLESSGRAWLSVDRLRAEGGGPSPGPGWLSRFAQMVAYADGKGWLTDDGSHLAAHVERIDH